MARNQNRILPMEGTPRPGGARRLLTKLAIAAVFVLILAAWIDGGEEPLRPISQPVELPEGR